MVDQNFLKQLEFHRIPEWSSNYIDYVTLTEMILDMKHKFDTARSIKNVRPKTYS
jgi:hypothetical protein